MMTRRIGYSIYEDQPDVIPDVLQHLGLDEDAVDALRRGIKESVEISITSV